MKLMHFVHTLRKSGAEVLVYELCRLHSQQGYSCAVVSFGPSDADFEIEINVLKECGVIIYEPKKFLTGVDRIKYYRSAIKDFIPDKIFAHSVLPSLYGRFANFGKKSKFITVLHAVNNFTGWVATAVEFSTGFFIDGVVSVSDAGGDNYCRKFGQKRKIRVIKNGINLIRYESIDQKYSRNVLGIDRDKKIILQVGRVCEVKNQELSLRVLAPVLLKNSNIEFWIAGLSESDSYVNYLKRVTDELKIDKSVKFLGSRSDVPYLLAASDLYLMPSIREAHSVAIIEALASGIPVIASNIEAFSFSKDMPGVSLVDGYEEKSWRVAVYKNLDGVRYSRELSDFSIISTAKYYVEVFE